MPYKNPEDRKRWRKEHPEGHRLYAKKWAKEHPEQAKIKSKKNQNKPRYKILKALRDAKQRCTNPEHEQYLYYGAKGILYLIEDREAAVIKLLPGFTTMIAAGFKPSLDRVDGTKHYSIDNIQVLEFVANSIKHTP